MLCALFLNLKNHTPVPATKISNRTITNFLCFAIARPARPNTALTLFIKQEFPQLFNFVFSQAKDCFCFILVRVCEDSPCKSWKICESTYNLSLQYKSAKSWGLPRFLWYATKATLPLPKPFKKTVVFWKTELNPKAKLNNAIGLLYKKTGVLTIRTPVLLISHRLRKSGTFRLPIQNFHEFFSGNGFPFH